MKNINYIENEEEEDAFAKELEKDLEKAIELYMKAISHGYQEKGYVPNQEKSGYEEALRRLNV